MLVQVLHGGKCFNLLCTEAPSESQVSPLLGALAQPWGSLLEVSVHVGHPLGRTGRRGRGVRELGGAGELQLFEPLYIFVTQGQELHVALLHRVGLLQIKHRQALELFPGNPRADLQRWSETQKSTKGETPSSSPPRHKLMHTWPRVCLPSFLRFIDPDTAPVSYVSRPQAHCSSVSGGHNSPPVGAWPSSPCRFVTLFLYVSIGKRNPPFWSLLSRPTLTVLFCTPSASTGVLTRVSALEPS